MNVENEYIPIKKRIYFKRGQKFTEEKEIMQFIKDNLLTLRQKNNIIVKDWLRLSIRIQKIHLKQKIKEENKDGNMR